MCTDVKVIISVYECLFSYLKYFVYTRLIYEYSRVALICRLLLPWFSSNKQNVWINETPYYVWYKDGSHMKKKKLDY